MDLALAWDLFSNLIDAIDAVGGNAALRARVVQARDRLLPYHVNRGGALQEWVEDFAPSEKDHRHLSFLFGLFPGRQITADTTPELFAAARRGLEMRGDLATGWSLAWKVNCWARLRDGDHAFLILKQPADARRGSEHELSRRRLRQPLRRASALPDRRQLRRRLWNRRDVAPESRGADRSPAGTSQCLARGARHWPPRARRVRAGCRVGERRAEDSDRQVGARRRVSRPGGGAVWRVRRARRMRLRGRTGTRSIECTPSTRQSWPPGRRSRRRSRQAERRSSSTQSPAAHTGSRHKAGLSAPPSLPEAGLKACPTPAISA